MTATLSQGIDQLFDEPWFLGGAASATDVPTFYQVALNGHGYIIDPAGYSRVTVPLRRESTDESVEPGEQTLNTGGAWRRSQDNWFLGAGQEYLDNRFAFISVYVHSGEDPSVRTRFWRSKGVNPWVEGYLSLLPEYAISGVAADPSTPLVMCAMGGFVYVACTQSGSQVLKRVSSVGTVVSITGLLGGQITSMTTDGFNLYIATGSWGIFKLVTGSTIATQLRPASPVPTITQGGTPGGTSYSYAVIGTDANGFKTQIPAGMTTTTTGNASLSVTNFNLISWTAIPGCVSYDVLKTDTAHTIGTTAGTSFTDDGTHPSVAYVAPAGNTLNFQATFVKYANTFLLGGAANQLMSVGNNGTTTSVMTHPNPNFTWNCGSGAPGTIYVAGNGGGKSELYGVQISTTNFALGAPYIAGQISDGEQINDLLYYEGLVILATSLGVRAASTSSQNGFLTTGPVITSLGASNCLAVYGSYVYFGITNYVENDGIWTQTSTTTSGLGRLNLNVFSNPLLPAYATDVMSTVQGTTSAVAMLGAVPWFGVQGSGMWLPNGNVVPLGYLESGWVRYGTVENKILVETDFRHQPLHGTVQIEVVPFGQASFLTTANNVQGSTASPYYVSAGNAVGEAYQMVPILTRSVSDPTMGPVLTRWTCRAIIVAARQDQIVVPIIWRDEVLSPEGDGTPIHMDLMAEWQFLKSLEAAGTAFIYQEGGFSYTCFIDQIEVKAEKWNDQKQMLEGILSAKLLTVN